MSETPDEVAVDSSESRYIYCLVDTSGVSSLTTDTTGIEKNSLSLIKCHGIGAVVHECDSIYDSDDEVQIKRWLMTHQQVVDAVGDVFGTPLPVRFDTVLQGDDETVRNWLSSNKEKINNGISMLRGCWEYRIDLRWNSDQFREKIVETDKQLQEIKRRKANSNAGKKFMLEKQWSNRLRECISNRKSELQELLKKQMMPVIVDDAIQENVDIKGEDTQTEYHSVVNFSVLADETDETALGKRLDTVSEERGVTIRFTGPWPPYTFAPELGL